MTAIQRLIHAGFASAALASAAVPALAWTVWPDVDFEWYANAGRTANVAAVEVTPAPRDGYIWAPAHWENRGTREAWVAGHWVRDDYRDQVAAYGTAGVYATGPTILYDRQGNVIPTAPEAYPLDTNRR